MKAHFSYKAIFWHIRPCFQNSETIFSKQFFLNYLMLNCVETCVNCVCNCVKPLFTTLKIQFSRIFFFWKRTSPWSELLDLLQKWHLKDINEKNHDYFYQGPFKSQYCIKWVSCLKKKWVVTHFYMAKWT